MMPGSMTGSMMPGPMTGPAMTGPMWMPSAPPTFARLMAWHPQPIPILPVIAALLVLLYLGGVLTLHRRGVRWPLQRTVWWMLGVLSVLAVTATGIDGYGMELFSVHMVQHMVLSMFSPILLVLGAPITLILRALPVRHGGGWNLRRVFLAVLHSRVAQVVAHPAVAVTLFLLSLYGLYFTPAFDFLMGTWWGHNLMLIHFLLIGMLYFWGVLGVDPSPRVHKGARAKMPAPLMRIFEIVVTVPFHAFFGVVIMMSVSLVVHFYATPISGWGISPLSDQALGGGIAWGFTELPTLVMLGVLFAQWQRSEARSTRRADRIADRDGDPDRTAYNEYLASLAGRDRDGEQR
jgi:putative membrane protein